MVKVFYENLKKERNYLLSKVKGVTIHIDEAMWRFVAEFQSGGYKSHHGISGLNKIDIYNNYLRNPYMEAIRIRSKQTSKPLLEGLDESRRRRRIRTSRELFPPPEDLVQPSPQGSYHSTEEMAEDSNGRQTLADYTIVVGPQHFNNLTRLRVTAGNMELQSIHRGQVATAEMIVRMYDTTPAHRWTMDEFHNAVAWPEEQAQGGRAGAAEASAMEKDEDDADDDAFEDAEDKEEEEDTDDSTH
ncbi:hypothetical protein LR48_Vigan07g148300 [Vigna angularis]|uniref:Uncharacterized protein n=1 Tax=Phaseolus angularis TaxID=3914 RepID=A0A0L9UYZ8_PHAAN|nr:hypothetical protein LR48_Vigan07g148300 [Vigna angularis]